MSILKMSLYSFFQKRGCTLKIVTLLHEDFDNVFIAEVRDNTPKAPGGILVRSAQPGIFSEHFIPFSSILYISEYD